MESGLKYNISSEMGEQIVEFMPRIRRRVDLYSAFATEERELQRGRTSCISDEIAFEKFEESGKLMERDRPSLRDSYTVLDAVRPTPPSGPISLPFRGTVKVSSYGRTQLEGTSQGTSAATAPARAGASRAAGEASRTIPAYKLTIPWTGFGLSNSEVFDYESWPHRPHTASEWPKTTTEFRLIKA
ncbi:hypothetical protein CNMCM5623_006982 [Aspergillus felis]|uniref:Uncharacterized protein n=1 Tax=Aspergillus felis TaxID=1287682 RepID=A0A8H6UNI4_9EURO|nr:hypothetical protein CNMCM5623_006982 [Aspergillus felis]